MEMDHEDDDYEPNNEDIEDTSPYILRRRPVEDPVAVERTNSAEKRAKTDPDNELSSTRLPTNIKSISKSLDHVSRQLKGMEYDTNTSLRVVHSVLVLQKEYLMNKQKKPEFYKAGFVRNRACQLFGISTHTYGKIMKSYFSLKGISFVYTSGKGRGNFDSKVTRIPQTQSVVIAIREFVRIRRAKTQRTTAKQILEFCIREGFISVPKDTGDPEAYEKKSFDTAYRSMRRWVERNGFKRDKRTGNIVLKEHIALHRDLYLKAFFANRALPPEEQLREVYLDESYIHQHYKKNDDSVWDPNDDQDIQYGKEKNKGNRYCFLCAIQGPNPRIFQPTDIQCNDEEAKLFDKMTLSTLGATDRGGVVPQSVWAFCPQQKKLHKGDYHKVFKSTNFMQWWNDQLIPNLQQPSIIIMDNASYHKAYPDTYPTSKSKKSDYIDFCTMKNIPFDPKDTIPIIREKIRTFKKTQKMSCELIAEANGHRVLFTPPCHSDLQPIELLWAKLKGNIGRKYDTDTTMTILKERLDEEFSAAYGWNESIEGFIRKSTAIARKFFTEIQQEETQETEDTDKNDSSIDSELSDGSVESDSEDELDLIGL